MNWENIFEATNSVDKPVPGWLFKEICEDVRRYPESVPDVAEHCMRAVVGSQRCVSLKGCLCVRHLAEDVVEFRSFLRRCPEVLEQLAALAQPPSLPQARSLEREEDKIFRAAADRAVRAVVCPPSADKATVRARCEGFGNYMPPPEEQEARTGVHGLLDEVVGFVGDAVADTVDDFREKGAVGAVRDGMADAADLIMDSVGSVWGFLGGRKVRERQAQQRAPVQRLCNPRPLGKCPPFVYQPPEEEHQAAAPPPVPAAAPYPPAPAPAAAPSPADLAPAPDEMADLLSFEDSPCRGGDLLDFDATRSPVLKLKQEGNELVRGKKFQEAAKCYEAAVAASDAKDAEVLSSLHANLALCYLQQQLFRRAAAAATSSLELDGTNSKALYRRCLAQKALKMMPEANRDFEALLLTCHDLTDVDIKRLRQGLT